MNVRRFATRAALAEALARRLKEAVVGRGNPAVMLSGGHAPRPAYQMLGGWALRPAPGLSLYYSDERYVPSTSDASNYRASLPLLQSLSLPEDRVLRVRTELPLEKAAADYARRLRELLDAGARLPLGLLGLGADGHTASLFSLADLERARGHLAISVHRPDGMNAVTVTPDVLARIEVVLMVVVGLEKREALAAFLAREASSIAWRAVEGCKSVETWCENEP